MTTPEPVPPSVRYATEAVVVEYRAEWLSSEQMDPSWERLGRPNRDPVAPTNADGSERLPSTD